MNVRKAETNNEGVFQFDNPDIGEAAIVVYKKGLAVGGAMPTILRDMEIAVPLLPPQNLSLRIINADMVSTPGARVRFMWVSGQFFVPVETLSTQGFPVLRSGDDGVLNIPDLPEKGYVKLLLTHSKYADSVVPYLPVNNKRQDIILYPGILIRGRVSHAGEGIGKALVSIFQPAVGQEQVLGEALTDREGMYHLRVKQGGYLAGARHPEYASPPPQRVEAVDPEKEYTVDLELLTPNVIHGSIVFPDGTPCVTARVLFRAKDNDKEEISTEAIRDADGRFRLNVAVEKGVIRILPPPGFMTESLPEMPVDLKGQKNVDLEPIRLKELPVVTGTIRTGDGQPAAGTLISSMNLEVPSWAITDAEGKFSLRLNYMPEERVALFRAEHNLRFLRQDFSVNLGKAEPVEVSLQPFEADQAHRPPQSGRNDLTPFIDKAAPEIKCSDWINSPPLTLDALKGKVVVLTFWGGFDESPEGINRLELLRALHDLYRDVSDVAVIGVHDSSGDLDEIEEYVKKYNLTFPIGRDAEPFVTFINYNVNFIPQTVLIDKQGVFRYFEIEGRLLELIKVLRRSA